MAKKAPVKEFVPKGKGLREVSTPDIDAWWSPKEGDAIEGRVVGAIKVKNSKGGGYRDVVLIKVAGETASCVTGSGKDVEPVTLKEGQIAAVGIKHKNRELLDYVEKKGWVACQAIEKISIGGGQTMWQFRVWGDPGDKVPWVDRSPASTATDPTGGDSNDDLPF